MSFTVSAPAARLPTLSVNPQPNETPGATIALSTLVTIADPDQVSYPEARAVGQLRGKHVCGQFVINGFGAERRAGDRRQSRAMSPTANSWWARRGIPIRCGHGFSRTTAGLTAWQSFTVKDPITIAAGATVEISSAYAGAVSFAGDTGTLQLDNSASFSGTVAGMTGSDSIDFADINPAKVQMPSYAGDASGGTLSVSDGTHSASIALLGNYLASTFTTASDGHGGTAVTDPAVLGGVQPLVPPPHA